MSGRPLVWTPVEQLNVRQHGQRTMQRVGVFEPHEIMAGAAAIIAWGPRTSGPGFCVAPWGSMERPFPYHCDTKALAEDMVGGDFLELAADMAMNGAPLALIDAAFLVFAPWRALKVRESVGHTPNGAWNPHYPDYAEEVLESYRHDHTMFGKRIEHDAQHDLPTVEIVTRFQLW